MGFFSSKIDSDAIRHIDELRTAVRKLTSDTADIDERLAKLEAAHLSLRGYTYALKPKLDELLTNAPEARPTSRDDLRRKSGFTPGRPMEHKDGN